MGKISEQTWMIEKNIAQHELATTGHLPTGNDLGGKFWDMVSNHYEVAKDTGHLARFDYYHCPFVVAVETTAHAIPVIHVPQERPYVPPVQPVVIVPTVCHTPVPSPLPGHPGNPENTPVAPSAVPEPSSLMLAMPIVFVSCAWLVWKRLLRFAVV